MITGITHAVQTAENSQRWRCTLACGHSIEVTSYRPPKQASCPDPSHIVAEPEPALVDSSVPDLGDDEKGRAAGYVKSLIRKHGLSNMSMIVAALVMENMRLTKEVNQLRGKLGIEPMKVFDV